MNLRLQLLVQKAPRSLHFILTPLTLFFDTTDRWPPPNLQKNAIILFKRLKYSYRFRCSIFFQNTVKLVLGPSIQCETCWSDTKPQLSRRLLVYDFVGSAVGAHFGSTNNSSTRLQNIFDSFCVKLQHHVLKLSLMFFFIVFHWCTLEKFWKPSLRPNTMWNLFSCQHVFTICQPKLHSICQVLSSRSTRKMKFLFAWCLWMKTSEHFSPAAVHRWYC